MRSAQGAVDQREARGDQQLLRLDPVRDVGDLHHVDAPDGPVQPSGTGEHGRGAHALELEQLADRDAIGSYQDLHLRGPSLGKTHHRQTLPETASVSRSIATRTERTHDRP